MRRPLLRAWAFTATLLAVGIGVAVSAHTAAAGTLTITTTAEQDFVLAARVEKVTLYVWCDDDGASGGPGRLQRETRIVIDGSSVGDPVDSEMLWPSPAARSWLRSIPVLN